MRLKIYISVFSLLALAGCSHTSALTPLTFGATSPVADCGWVQVSETQKVLFTTTVRQFDDALFYCCPGEDGKMPECRETEWIELK